MHTPTSGDRDYFDREAAAIFDRLGALAGAAEVLAGFRDIDAQRQLAVWRSTRDLGLTTTERVYESYRLARLPLTG